jgi:hypothetical protein
MITYTTEEIAAERLDDMSRLPEKFEMDLELIQKLYLDPYCYHACTSIAQMLMDNTSIYLLERPAVIFDPEAYEHAHAAHTALFNLHQRIALLSVSGLVEELVENTSSVPVPPSVSVKNECGDDCCHPNHNHEK